MAQIAVLARHETPVTAPCFGPTGELHTISINGEIFRYLGSVEGDGDLQIESWGNSSGQPQGLAFDGQAAFVCEAAHQALFRIQRTEEDGVPRQEVEPYVREYEGSALLGPHGVCISKDTGVIYFTDSGPMGETSFANPKGSVFAIQGSTQLLIPLTLQSLAHPSGICLSPEGNCVYVAETCKNRILRYARRPTGVYHLSVFYQMAGRLGPTALCCASNGNLYIAHYDLSENTEDGRIVVVNSDGEMQQIVSVPGPEINGLCLSPNEKFLLITEASTASVYRIDIAGSF